MKKKNIRVVGTAVIMSMVVSGMAGCGKVTNGMGNEVKTDVVNVAETSSDKNTGEDKDEEKAVTDAISSGIEQGSISTGKDETVYVFTDNAGAVTKVTVNDVIKNVEKGSIEDSSELKDIKNIHGDETFKESDGKLVWESVGNDITYQGTTDKKLPVDMKISYELDGKSVDASSVAGATGHLKMTYQYINNTKTTRTIDGEDKEVIVPFIVASGMLIPSENVSNISIDHGKVLDEGNNSIVVGYAVPGVVDCIKSQVKDENGILDKISIPESFTIEADVTDFEQKMCLTAVLPGAFSSDKTEDIDLDEINDKMDELKDATDKLIDGTDKLDNGAGDLKEGSDKLADGAKELKDGTKSLKEGTGKVKNGSGDLADGTGTLKKGMKQAKAGNKKLVDGSKKVSDGSKTVKTNLNKLSDGAAKAEAGAKQIADGTGKLKASGDTLVTGAGSAATGATDIATGLQTVDSSLAQINAGMSAKEGLVNGAKALADGAENAEAGVNTLITTLQGTPASIDAEIDKIMAQVTALAPTIKNSSELAAMITNIDQAITANGGTAPVDTVLNTATGGAITSYAAYTKLVQANYSVIALQGVKESMTKTIAGSADKIKELKTGMSSLKTGAKGVSDGVNKVYAATSKLETDGTKKLAAGAATLKSGLDTLKGGVSQYVAGVGTLDTGAKSLYQGNKSISSGSAALYTGMVTLDNGIDTLSKGIGSLYNGNIKLYKGAVKLDAGAKALNRGLITLDEGAGKLDDGTGKLADGAGELADGAGKLADGTSELNDGMIKFNDEGIKKITDMFGDDLANAIDLVKAIADEGKEYKNYSGINDDMDGTVKFIYKTEGISKDDKDKE